jgi:FlaA1/EpsC-like NDP-sugar epimerase
MLMRYIDGFSDTQRDRVILLMQKIVITGATGMIGSALIRQAVEKNRSLVYC